MVSVVFRSPRVVLGYILMDYYWQWPPFSILCMSDVYSWSNCLFEKKKSLLSFWKAFWISYTGCSTPIKLRPIYALTELEELDCFSNKERLALNSLYVFYVCHSPNQMYPILLPNCDSINPFPGGQLVIGIKWGCPCPEPCSLSFVLTTSLCVLTLHIFAGLELGPLARKPEEAMKCHILMTSSLLSFDFGLNSFFRYLFHFGDLENVNFALSFSVSF